MLGNGAESDKMLLTFFDTSDLPNNLLKYYTRAVIHPVFIRVRAYTYTHILVELILP
jgi:hypothetical protein